MNLDTATEQEVFDYVAAHLLRQGRKSQQSGHPEQCRYKMGTLMCAAGCLLEPGQYVPSMEGRSWAELVRTEKVSANHYSIISQLQNIHDTYAPIEWPDQLRMLAARRGLTTNF